MPGRQGRRNGPSPATRRSEAGGPPGTQRSIMTVLKKEAVRGETNIPDWLFGRPVVVMSVRPEDGCVRIFHLTTRGGRLIEDDCGSRHVHQYLPIHPLQPNPVNQILLRLEHGRELDKPSYVKVGDEGIPIQLGLRFLKSYKRQGKDLMFTELSFGDILAKSRQADPTADAILLPRAIEDSVAAPMEDVVVTRASEQPEPVVDRRALVRQELPQGRRSPRVQQQGPERRRQLIDLLDSQVPERVSGGVGQSAAAEGRAPYQPATRPQRTLQHLFLQEPPRQYGTMHGCQSPRTMNGPVLPGSMLPRHHGNSSNGASKPPPSVDWIKILWNALTYGLKLAVFVGVVYGLYLGGLWVVHGVIAIGTAIGHGWHNMTAGVKHGIQAIVQWVKEVFAHLNPVKSGVKAAAAHVASLARRSSTAVELWKVLARSEV